MMTSNTEPSSGARLTMDMLPNIEAVVFRKVVQNAAGWTLLWGVLSLTQYGPLWGEPADVFSYAYIVTGILLISLGLYGLVRNSAIMLMYNAVAASIVGVVLIASSVLGLSLLAEHEPGDDFPPIFLAITGLLQIVWATRQFARYSRIKQMGLRCAATTTKQRKSMKAHLKTLMQEDENFDANWLRMSIQERATLAMGRTYGFRGQLVDDKAIIVAKLLHDCHCIERDAAKAFKYQAGGRATAKLPGGKVLIRFAPISTISWKLWADLELLADDLRRATRARKLSPKLVMAILRQAGPRSRARAVAAIPGIRRLDGTKTRNLILEALDDEAPNVRATAIDVSAALAIDDFHEQLLPVLKDTHADSRRATAEYLCAYPSVEALGALDKAAATEQEPAIRKRLERAIKKCRKLVANPYAQTR